MKKKILILSIILVIIITMLFGYYIYNKNKISSDYIAIFHGKDNGIIYETYIYKALTCETTKDGYLDSYIIETDDDGDDCDNVVNSSNMGFKYISIKRKFLKLTIVNEGVLTVTDEVFMVAEDNKSYDYVTIPNDSKKYTIEEFENMFLLN